jgi:hypothetical protein
MVNVSGNDAIGLGYYDSTIPSTDINGDNRVRDNQFVDPGAFTTSALPIYRGIDSSGNWDYATFTLAEADVENIAASGEFGGSGTTLQQKNGAIVFNASAGTYDGLIFSWGLTTSANNNVTFQASSGSEHNGEWGTGVIIQDNSAVTSYNVLMAGGGTNHCVFDGIEFKVRAGVTSRTTSVRTGIGHIWRNCLFSTETPQTLNGSEDTFTCGDADHPIVFENCVTSGGGAYSYNSTGTGSKMRFINCTHLTSEGMFNFYTYAGASQDAEIVNCVNLGGGNSLGDNGPAVTTITGSNNIGGSSESFSASGLAVGGHDWTVTTDTEASSTGNQVVYVSSTGKLVNVSGNDAIGFGTYDSTIPTTDINGDNRVRDGFVDPGAFTTSALPVYRGIDSGGNSRLPRLT